MAAIKKKEITLDSIKNKFSTKTKYKETAFYNCGEAFLDACGLPGPVMGSVNLFMGHSDTSKSTAMVLAAVDAQKRGDLPVFIITEKKFSWEHAIELGLDATLTPDGSYDGSYIYNDSFDYIEQATDYINSLLDAQERGELPYNLLFCFDSIGSIPCLATFNGAGGGMHNAKVLADKIGMGLHSRITKSRKEDYPYCNTLLVINQVWVELPDNPYSQAAIRPKGGEALFFSAALVFLFGNQKNSGVSHITATKNGRTVSYAIRTKISVLKNHINGISFKDGKIIAVPQGYIKDDKIEIDKYKKQYSEYWNKILGADGDVVYEEEGEDDILK
jgi:hypothetical protein